MRRSWLVPAAILIALPFAACSTSTTPSSGPGSTTPGTGAGGGTIGAAPAGGTTPPGSALAGVRVPDGRTAIAIRPIGAPTFPWLGTDGKYHIDYDVMLTNATTLPATLERIEVVDAHQPTKVLASFSGAQLVDPGCKYGECNRLRALPSAPAADTVLAPSQSRSMLIDFTVDTQAQAPAAVLHHIYAIAPVPPVKDPVPVDYLAGPFDTSGGTPRVISPPVKGPNWVALNGCCLPDSWHRSALSPSNGMVTNSQRFAIDWKQANAQGQFVTGDATKNESYVDYGAEIYAVADGTVVSTLDQEEANVPGILPATDPVLAKKLTLENADGNHVILDIGAGVYAMYAHMIKGTLTVKPGDKVKRGDVIGHLGNTGNASTSHMHFQLMNDPSILEGDGLPYVIDRFTYRGQLEEQAFLDSNDYVEGSFFPPNLPAGEPRTKQLPLTMAIVDFPTD